MLRIAMLCHSTNPRGGVAHALAVAEALVARGHEVVVHAPDAGGRGFPRSARCGLVSVPATPAAGASLADLVEVRIADYARHFAGAGLAHWDILHVHDGIGANALRALGAGGRFVRTVHHLDDFSDPRLARWQAHSVHDAAAVACVSRHWQDVLHTHWQVRATLVGNGVDLQRFTPLADGRDAEVRQRYGLAGATPLVLSVGGIEGRKNPVRLLEAFLQLRTRLPHARLLMVGGASLLDHSSTHRQFQAVLKAAGLVECTPANLAGQQVYCRAEGVGPSAQPAAQMPEIVVQVTGAVPDADMAPLFRAAQVLAFPSLHEGFGLVALEALACGTPLVASRIPPFTEFLDDSVCVFADPLDVTSIADALQQALHPALHAPLRPDGLARAAHYRWAACAERHEAWYAEVLARRKRASPLGAAASVTALTPSAAELPHA